MTGRIGSMCCLGLGREKERREELTGNIWKKGLLRGGVQSWSAEEWFDPTEGGQRSCRCGSPRKI
jgi:hypothetical protein